jgi:hypothetical protein
MLNTGEYDVPQNLIPCKKVTIYPPQEKEQVPLTDQLDRTYQRKR